MLFLRKNINVDISTRRGEQKCGAVRLCAPKLDVCSSANLIARQRIFEGDIRGEHSPASGKHRSGHYPPIRPARNNAYELLQSKKSGARHTDAGVSSLWIRCPSKTNLKVPGVAPSYGQGTTFVIAHMRVGVVKLSEEMDMLLEGQKRTTT